MGRRNTPEAFWARVTKPSAEECWLWTGARTTDPYGNPSYGQLSYQGKLILAHRLAWALTYTDPGELKVLHRCDNPPCCNPRHLFLGTQQDNMLDRKEKGRHSNYPDRDPATGQWVNRKGVK